MCSPVSDGKVVQFVARKRPEPAPDERLIWVCACGNAERFRLFEDGDVQCRDCGSVASRCRVFDPTRKV
jgi:hypothetical protein